MPRLTDDEAAALDMVGMLLDSLVHTHLIIDQRHLEFYQAFGVRVRRAIKEENCFLFDPHEIEHAVLRVIEHKRHKPMSVQVTQGNILPRELGAGVYKAAERIAASMDSTLKELQLPREWYSGLSTNVFLAENPMAPAESLAWLCKLGVIGNASPAWDENKEHYVYRATLLLRSYLHIRQEIRKDKPSPVEERNELLEGETKLDDEARVAFATALKESGLLSDEDCAAIMKRAIEIYAEMNTGDAKPGGAKASDEWWSEQHRESLRSFLAHAAQQMRLPVEHPPEGSEAESTYFTKAQAASLIGAALVLIEEKNIAQNGGKPKRVRYSVGEDGKSDHSITGEVAATLNKLGLKISAKTIYGQLVKTGEDDMPNWIKKRQPKFRENRWLFDKYINEVALAEWSKVARA